MTETITPQQFDELCRVMGDNLKRDDFERVLERYPGKESAGTCLPENGAPLQFATSCMKAVAIEGMTFPFLSRVVEQKWKDEKFRSSIVGKVRVLVRAAAAVEPQAKTIADALTALTAALAASPAPQCPGRTTCDFVRQSRPALQIVIGSLDQFDALKALHDSLHVLQVNGADWLDEDQTDDTRDLPRENFVEMVGKLRDVAAAVEKRLPGDVVECCRRCHGIATAAVQRLAIGAGDESEYALAELRTLIAREPEIIDEAMFVLSRDLPLRTLRDLIDSGVSVPGAPGQQMTEASEALRRMSEALRARILEHALWQATEIRIRALDRILGSPTGSFLRDLFTEWSAIRQNLRTLIDPSPNVPTVDLPLNAALVLYERALPIAGKPTPPGPSAEERLVEIVAAFNEFRLKASLQFLTVDKALKAEFSSLLPLRESLQTLESQVSLFCACP
jgi:hypothetical protein